MKAAEHTTIEKSERPPVDIGEAPPADLEERKRLIAYELWEDEGQPEGKAEEHWNRACLIVMSLDLDRVVASGTEAAPEWLQRQRAEQAIDPQASKKEQPSVIPSVAEAPLESIRRRIAERKTA